MSQILEIEKRVMYPPIAEFREMDWMEKLHTVMRMDKVYSKYKKEMGNKSMAWESCAVGEKFAWSSFWQSDWNAFDTVTGLMEYTDTALKDLGTDFPRAIFGERYSEAMLVLKEVKEYHITDKLQKELER